MSSSNCSFLTCIQISQEAGQVVWYSHLFQNFPQFIVIHTVKGFGIANKGKIDPFWISLAFSMIQQMLAMEYMLSHVQFSDLMNCNLPDSPVHGILQALKQVAISYSRRSFRPRDWMPVSCVTCIDRRVLYCWATWEAPYTYTLIYIHTHTCVCMCVCVCVVCTSVRGISQARLLEWVAIPFSRGSSQPWDQTCVYCIASRFFIIWATKLWNKWYWNN